MAGRALGATRRRAGPGRNGRRVSEVPQHGRRVSLKGSLIGTELYTIGDFQASENGESTVTTLNLQLVFNVFNSNEDVIAQAELSETADVKVTNKAYNASEHGDASGSGSVIIVE